MHRYRLFYHFICIIFMYFKVKIFAFEGQIREEKIHPARRQLANTLNDVL